MDRLSEIIKGWENYLFPNNETKELAEKRMKVCLLCEHLSPVNVCRKCGCFMPAKTTLSNKKCPLKKW